MEGETETFLKGGPAAVTESLKVLTCIWAGCQPEQTGVPLHSRTVQLESFAVSHSRAVIATHAAKTRDKVQQILNKYCLGIYSFLSSNRRLVKGP